MGKPTAWVGEQLFGIKPLTPPAPPPDPAVARRKAEEEAKGKSIERKRKLKKYGRQSTFATSGAGLLEPATVGKKTLLGQ